jgi:hypothetical protein
LWVTRSLLMGHIPVPPRQPAGEHEEGTKGERHQDARPRFARRVSIGLPEAPARRSFDRLLPWSVAADHERPELLVDQLHQLARRAGADDDEHYVYAIAL